MKTAELTGAALDWAVARCEGGVGENQLLGAWYAPSTDWAQGGPIIEREDIAISPMPDGLCSAYTPKGTRWMPQGEKTVEVFHWYFKQQGYTTLIAAMRCYVASKLGEEVDVPKELQP